MDAIEIMREQARMCKESSCLQCGLLKDGGCRTFRYEKPTEAVAIVEQWAKEHLVRTYKSVFLEMFPNVKTTKEGHPDFCLKRLLGAKGEYDICSCDITCGDCWSREVEE